MLSPSEYKKRKSLLAFGTDLKKYEELYNKFMSEGYSKSLCEEYADVFVNEAKKPAYDDIIQLAHLYDRIFDYKSASFYLDMLAEKKLSGEDKFQYCVESLKNQSKLGRWRDAEDFRTENINFLQNYTQKRSLTQQADLYIALALTDCAGKHYREAAKLINFGYKPQGRNDTKLLEIMITAVYMCAKSGDAEALDGAVRNANACLRLFNEFEFVWSKEYYKDWIEKAAEGIV